jgi:hypothetical protein
LRIAAACLVVLAAGVVGVRWLDGAKPPAPVPSVLTGEATDSVTGATIAVVVTGHGDRSNVRATVDGLRPAIPYQLFAVTTDGRRLAVGSWLGTAGSRTVSGDIPATVGQIAVFTVAQQDGAVIVSVRFTAARSSPSSTDSAVSPTAHTPPPTTP